MAENVSSISHFHNEDTAVKGNRRKDEGGREAWLTVLGSFLVYYSSFGIINSFGFFQNYYQTEYLLNASPAQISIIGTLQMALMNVLSTVSGGICDEHGIRVRNPPLQDIFCSQGASYYTFSPVWVHRSGF